MHAPLTIHEDAIYVPLVMVGEIEWAVDQLLP